MNDGSTARWIVLDDFRAGMHGDYHASSGQPTDSTRGFLNVPGAATIQNTYRCCADPHTGSLIPLPKLVLTQSQTLLPNGNTNVGTTFYPSGRAAAFLTDAVVRVGAGDSSGAALTTDPTETVALYQFYWDSGGASTYRWYTQGIVWQSFRTGVPVRHCVWSKITTGIVTTYPIYPGGLEVIQSIRSNVLGAPAWTSYNAVVVGSYLGMGTFIQGAIPAAENAVMTYDTDMSQGANYTLANSFAQTSTCFSWPRLGATRTVGRYDIFEQVSQQLLACGVVYAHQARALFPAFVGQVSDATASFAPYDVIVYTPPADFLSNDALTSFTGRAPTGLTIGGENVSQVCVLGSISADELLVVKMKDGGYIVRGDMDNPTIQRLPFLQSTGALLNNSFPTGLQSHGIMCPAGFVYGALSGVYAYTGGEQAEDISPQIDGFFWKVVSGTEITSNYGRFGYIDPFVAVPNNFFYDTRTKSWWRIELPDATNGPLPFSVYYNIGNKLRCFPYKLTPTRNEAFYDIDPAVLAKSYSWQSQPLFESAERVLTVQQIELVATPGSAATTPTVTVTLSGYNQDGSTVAPVSKVFTLLANTAPQQQSKDVVNFSAMHIQVRIEATDGSTDAAPKVHSVKVGVADRATVRKS